jgi:hypothetical protein
MNMRRSLVTDGTIAAPFTAAAPSERVDLVAEALGRHNIQAIVVGTGAEARERVLGMLPQGAEVHWGTSRTLEEIGLTPELLAEGRYDALRPRYLPMDRATHAREIRKLVAAPDFMLGSVQAITDDGALVVVSYSASQIGSVRQWCRAGDPRCRQPEDRGRSRRGDAPRPGACPAVRGRLPAEADRCSDQARQAPRHLRGPQPRAGDRDPGARAGRRLNGQESRSACHRGHLE